MNPCELGGRNSGGMAILVLSLLMAGCGSPSLPREATAGQSRPQPGGLTRASIDTIRVADRIMVIMTDIPNPYPPIEQRVREDGTITLPLNVQVTAAGKKAGELENEIRNEFVPKYYNRLTVNVKVEQRTFYVRGAVRRPDRFEYMGEMTVLKAIGVAGDFNEFAKKADVLVTRGDGTKIKVDCKKALKNPKFDLPIFPGDEIYVPQKIWF